MILVIRIQNWTRLGMVDPDTRYYFPFLLFASLNARGSIIGYLGSQALQKRLLPSPGSSSIYASAIPCLSTPAYPATLTSLTHRFARTQVLFGLWLHAALSCKWILVLVASMRHDRGTELV